MEKSIDLRGLVCPEPVLRTKKLLDDLSIEKIHAIVDSDVNVNNLKRLARSVNVQFGSHQQSDFYVVTLERVPADVVSCEPLPLTSRQSTHQHQTLLSHAPMTGTASGTVLLISKEKFGDGDAQLSLQLMDLFLQTLLQSGHYPRAILLVNSGVKLLAVHAPTSKVLNDFKETGTEVLACGLCVEFYGLTDIPVDQITNMFAICEFLMAADKIIQP